MAQGEFVVAVQCKAHIVQGIGFQTLVRCSENEYAGDSRISEQPVEVQLEETDIARIVDERVP